MKPKRRFLLCLDDDYHNHFVRLIEEHSHKEIRTEELTLEDMPIIEKAQASFVNILAALLEELTLMECISRERWIAKEGRVLLNDIERRLYRTFADDMYWDVKSRLASNLLRNEERIKFILKGYDLNTYMMEIL